MTAHGKDHWDRVERNARMLAAVTPGADLEVCVAFARLHDTRRMNEFTDPEHGPRAAARARELHVETFTPGRLDTLFVAIRDHDLGLRSTDPTIGVCWDADRLDLPRVGIAPDPELMSTEAGCYLAGLASFRILDTKEET